MKTRLFALIATVVCLFSAGLAVASGGEPPRPAAWPLATPLPPIQLPPAAHPEPGGQMLSASGVGASAVPALGQPGTNFRYVQTFGETLVPYFADNAHLFRPAGVALDGAGNVYITEGGGDRMMEFTASGTFSMSIGHAGVWLANNTDQIGSPAQLALDKAGNVWIVENGSARVSQWSPSGGYVSQLGETWNSGPDQGLFDSPQDIAFDSTGRIYVSDTNNQRVQIFDSTGAYSATLGTTYTCGSTPQLFCSPGGLAVDAADRLYVADTANHRVTIFDAAGNSLASLGTTGSCGQSNAQFCAPMDVALGPDGKVYVADTENNRVQIFAAYPSLAYLATLGVTGQWGNDNNHLSDPTSVVVGQDGTIYVADQSNDRVQAFDNNRVYLRTFGVTGVPYLTDNLHFVNPSDAAIDPAGNLIVLEEGGQRLVKLSANGVPQFSIGQAGSAGSGSNRFCWPEGVATDSQGRIYVADNCNNRVQIYSASGVYVATLGTGWGTGNYQFEWPQGVAVGPNGYVYVADTNNERIQVYDGNRNYVTTIGHTREIGSDNTHFNWPLRPAVDQAGNIYVADAYNRRVQKCNLSGVCSTFAGVTGEWGNDFAHFSEPDGVAVDAQGRVYVDDQHNGRVQVFDQSGAYLTTIGGARGPLNGQMQNVMSVKVDSGGNAYVVDRANARVQKFVYGVPGWWQSNINGFGDPSTVQVSALSPFSGQLYAGTNWWGSGTSAQLWRTGDGISWSPVMTDGFGGGNMAIFSLIDFSGSLYASTYAWDAVRSQYAGGQIWGSGDGLSWINVVTGGFGDPNNYVIGRMAVFSNTLFAGTWSSTVTQGAQIWSTPDGLNWTNVMTNGFGNPGNASISTMADFDSSLYIGTASANSSRTGGEVWRTADGMTWDKVSADGFNSVSNTAVLSLAEFDSHLYAGTNNGGYGAQVWRCPSGSCDAPGSWEQVVTNGFGNPLNAGVDGLYVFDHKLYAVTRNFTAGVEIWRTGNGTDWEPVSVGGFGDRNNIVNQGAEATFANRLFLGALNRYTGGEIWQNAYQVFLPLTRR